MHLIQNNPYRIIGLLVGAKAREQERQIKRLKQFIEAEQDIQDDYSFPTLGQINRTLESVNDAASKLNLDSDKMNAALFWFFNGNPITDEPAFDAIKEADLDQVINIWTKLTSKGEVTQRNASAYSNLGTLCLCGILDGTNTNEAILEQGISLKLKFLESDFILNFKSLVTDETFKTTKIELQLLFLNQVQIEIEHNKTVSINKFIEILKKHEFVAKEEFFKSFVHKQIEEIEKKIEESKNKRKASKANSINIGKTLQKHTADTLQQLKSILGFSNIKYASIADKVANEILQCSIDYFNYHQEKESEINFFESAVKLAKTSESIAVGKLTKDRIVDTLNALEEMKDIEISQAIQVLQSIKDAYETNEKEIRRQVKLQEFGLSFNQSINWNKVNEMIANSLDWCKVTELILQTIPKQNVEKIKMTNNTTEISEYKSLVNFLLGKINYSYKNKIGYICYWETQIEASYSNSSTDTLKNTYRPTTSSSSSSSDSSFADNWPFWVIGVGVIIGAIIGAISAGIGGFIGGVIIGGFLAFMVVGLISKIID